jgi:UDP-4-amino-4,6-dideoxy-N-acetyl-beta-L-altrosamine N-acetyltransferase
MAISLKPVDKDDIELIRKWRNSDLINNVSFSNQYISAEMQTEWFEKLSGNNSFIHWIIMADDKRVGYAAVRDIDPVNGRCEFASLYLGEPEYLGSGIGAKAEYFVIDYVYNHYKVKEICCEVLETNLPVIKLHKKFGFRVAEVIKDRYTKNNEFIGVYQLSLKEEDWKKNQPALQKILFK